MPSAKQHSCGMHTHRAIDNTKMAIQQRNIYSIVKQDKPIIKPITVRYRNERVATGITKYIFMKTVIQIFETSHLIDYV